MPAWDRTTTEELQNYTSTLHQQLKAVRYPDNLLKCKDLQCEQPSHSTERDDTVLYILCANMETSYTCLPLTGRAGRVGRGWEFIPGWSTEVEPFRLKSNACYIRWMTAGKPRQGALHEAKLSSHALFRPVVRRVKRSENLHQAQWLFGAAMEGDIKLFVEMRRIKTGKGQMEEMAETVDGVTGQQEIADTFATIFKTL